MKTEKRCKICGEWFDSKKIAMHYWNIHRKKYNEYKGADEETRTVEEETTENKMEIKNEKKTEPTKENNCKTTENETKENKTDTNTTTREDWKDPEVINEIYRPYKTVNKYDLLDNGEVINEWC